MRIIARHFAAAVAFTLVGVAGAQAASVDIDRVETDPVISQFGMDPFTGSIGSDIVGMLVTAVFDDGATEELVWTKLPNHTPGVSTTGFSLKHEGLPWELKSDRLLTSLLFEADLGGAIFDTLADDSTNNTTGTHYGFPFMITGGDPLVGTIAVTYSGSFIIQGSSRATDTFTDMFVDFSGLEGGGFLGTLFFDTDMDNLLVNDDFSPVPLPGSLALMLPGLAALGLARRKRRA